MKLKFSFEKATTLLVIIASLGSLFIIYRQTNLMSKQFDLQRLEQHKSVLPYLSMFNTGQKDFYAYSMANKGIGPALINEINITYKDSTYINHDLRLFFNTVIKKEDSLFKNYNDIGHSSVRSGMLIPANHTFNMITHNADDRTKIKHLRKWFNEEIEIEIVFSSIYGEKWVINNHHHTPLKIKSIVE